MGECGADRTGVHITHWAGTRDADYQTLKATVSTLLFK